MSSKNTADNFWSRVSQPSSDECWEWLGALTSAGYGNLSWHGKTVQAHRLAYALSVEAVDLHTGFRVPDKAARYRQFVLHTCDNRKCCNPRHLFLGSMRANLLDAYAKGRKTQPRSQHTNAKLTAEQVREIRSRYAMGSRQVDLAAQHGVSQRAISLVVRRETYRDIPE